MSRLGAFWIKFGGWHSEGENILVGREKRKILRGSVKLLETEAGGAGEDL